MKFFTTNEYEYDMILPINYKRPYKFHVTIGEPKSMTFTSPSLLMHIVKTHDWQIKKNDPHSAYELAVFR